MVEICVYELWESLDTWRLWWLPPKLCEPLDRLSMHTVLEADGLEDTKRAVRLLGETDWDSPRPVNSSRMELPKNWFLGHSGNAE